MVTQDYLKDVFDYDAETGLFSRKKVFTNVSKVGVPLGAKQSNGYIIINIAGRVYRAHRLAWLYVHGEWPEEDIDHINGDVTDNRICNLRKASRSENLCNTKLPRTNTSGFKGVSWDSARGKWFGKVQFGNKQYPVGRFDTIEQAVDAVNEKRIELHGEFAKAA